MMTQNLAVLAVIVIMATTLLMLVGQKWRNSIIVLAVQYLAVFWLVSLVWPIGLAAVKLVVGWMVCALIGSSLPERESEEDFQGIFGNIFHIATSGAVWLVVFSIGPTLVKWIPTGLVILWGGMILIGVGILQIGVANHNLRVIFGLVTVISGFEIIYAAVENSVLVTGLLAITNLGLALVGAYLTAEVLEEESP